MNLLNNNINTLEITSNINSIVASEATSSPLEQFMDIPLVSLSIFISNAPVIFTVISLYALIVPTIIISLHIYGNNKGQLVPSRWSIALESIYATLNGIVKEQLGKEVYFPFIYSLFFFILISNLIGNVPYSFTLGTSIIISIGLSATIWFGVTILGITTHKFKFLSFFLPEGTPLALVPLLVLIELVSYIARAFSLGIRLFSNLAAGHTLMAILSGFLYNMFTSSFLLFFVTLIPFGLFIAITLLEVAVSIIQAYVFTLLTASYLKDAIYLH